MLRRKRNCRILAQLSILKFKGACDPCWFSTQSLMSLLNVAKSEQNLLISSLLEGLPVRTGNRSKDIQTKAKGLDWCENPRKATIEFPQLNHPQIVYHCPTTPSMLQPKSSWNEMDAELETHYVNVELQVGQVVLHLLWTVRTHNSNTGNLRARFCRKMCEGLCRVLGECKPRAARTGELLEATELDRCTVFVCCRSTVMWLLLKATKWGPWLLSELKKIPWALHRHHSTASIPPLRCNIEFQLDKNFKDLSATECYEVKSYVLENEHRSCCSRLLKLDWPKTQARLKPHANLSKWNWKLQSEHFGATWIGEA